MALADIPEVWNKDPVKQTPYLHKMVLSYADLKCGIDCSLVWIDTYSEESICEILIFSGSMCCV